MNKATQNVNSEWNQHHCLDEMEILHFEPEHSIFLGVPYEDFFFSLRTFLSSSLEDKRYIKNIDIWREEDLINFIFNLFNSSEENGMGLWGKSHILYS